MIHFDYPFSFFLIFLNLLLIFLASLWNLIEFGRFLEKKNKLGVLGSSTIIIIILCWIGHKSGWKRPLQLLAVGVIEDHFMMDHVIGGKFKLGRKIGSGSFGELYLGMLLFVSLICLKQLFFFFSSFATWYCIVLYFLNMFFLF